MDSVKFLPIDILQYHDPMMGDMAKVNTCRFYQNMYILSYILDTKTKFDNG